MNLQKDKRWRSKKYLDWIKQQPCSRCGRPSEPHHIKGVGNYGGVGLKAPDWAVIPLCHECHMMFHSSPELWPSQFEIALNTLGRAVTEGLLK